MSISATRKKVGLVLKAYEYADGSMDHGADIDTANEPMSRSSSSKVSSSGVLGFAFYISLSSTFTLPDASANPECQPQSPPLKTQIGSYSRVAPLEY